MTGKKWTIIEGLACNVFRLKLVCKVVKYYLNPISQFSTLSTIWITLFKFKWKKKLSYWISKRYDNRVSSKATEKDVLEEQQVIYSYIYFFFEKEQEGLWGQKEGLLSKGRGIE